MSLLGYYDPVLVEVKTLLCLHLVSQEGRQYYCFRSLHWLPMITPWGISSWSHSLSDKAHILRCWEIGLLLALPTGNVWASLTLFKVPPCPSRCFCPCRAASSSTLLFMCLFHLLFGSLHWNESCIRARILAHSLFIPIVPPTSGTYLTNSRGA